MLDCRRAWRAVAAQSAVVDTCSAVEDLPICVTKDGKNPGDAGFQAYTWMICLTETDALWSAMQNFITCIRACT